MTTQPTDDQTGPNKTAFVTSLPSDLPVADVVARAKEAGIELTKAYVHTIRSNARIKAGGGKRNRGKRGKKHVASATAAHQPAQHPSHARKPADAGGKLSKSDFVRQQPVSMRTSEVIAAAKKAGLTISHGLVYMVRGPRAKGRAGRPTATPTAAAVHHAAPVAHASPVGPVGSADADYRRLVVRLGVERCKVLLAEVERKLHSLLAGH